jgi:hypothetical protein
MDINVSFSRALLSEIAPAVRKAKKRVNKGWAVW